MAPEAIEEMCDCLTVVGNFANPASFQHSFGELANIQVEQSRSEIANVLHCNPRDLVFTSGATEADNLAIKGIALAHQNQGNHIVCAASEHKAVLDTCRYLETQGFQVTYLRPGINGRIELDNILAALTKKTVLVSLMHVNNETGVIQDIEKIAFALNQKNILFHVDAAQSVGKLPIDLTETPIDLLSISGHKIYGPKGIGCLFVRNRKKTNLLPLLHGGGQEYGLRPGTLGAFNLTHQIVVVSAMLFNQNALKGQAFNDGIITQRNTFQKYFTQNELKDFIVETLETNAIPVAPGIFFIFKNQDAEQRFLLGRQRSQRNAILPSQRPHSVKQPKLSRNEKKYLTYKHLIDPLWHQMLELGRLPDKTEVGSLIELTQAFGSINKAIRFTLDNHDEELFEHARKRKIEDLITYFALQAFSKRKPYKHLEAGLQKDIKAFFGDYENAVITAKSILFKISDTALISDACQKATEQGLGHLDEGEALHLHTRFVNELPALLRIYIGCATMLYGDIEQTDLIKIHTRFLFAPCVAAASINDIALSPSVKYTSFKASGILFSTIDLTSESKILTVPLSVILNKTTASVSRLTYLI